MQKTKIIATLGPACEDSGVIQHMLREGLDVFRINMSHNQNITKLSQKR